MSKEDKKTCGIIIPISAIDGCSESHWSEVMEILTEAIEDAGFEANIVSNSDDVGVIHKRIIQNLYDNPIVVCDVSAKNPNVMFELGMRLAFDKPTIIVKDDQTVYSFDTSAIEHIEYPRDLRFSKIVEFKETLSAKIKATYERSQKDSSYTTFLKHFGEFTVAKIDQKEVSGQEFIMEELKNLRNSMIRLERGAFRRDRFYRNSKASANVGELLDICLRDASEEEVKNIFKRVSTWPSIIDIDLVELNPGHFHLRADVNSVAHAMEIEKKVYSLLSVPSKRRGLKINRES